MLVNAPDNSTILIGPSTTDLISRLARIFSDAWSDEGHVVISEASHDSNRHPWLVLGQQGIKVDEWVTHSTNAATGDLWPMETLLKVLKPETKVVAVSHASGLTGDVLDLALLVKTVRSVSSAAKIIVDGTQFVRHR